MDSKIKTSNTVACVVRRGGRGDEKSECREETSARQACVVPHEFTRLDVWSVKWSGPTEKNSSQNSWRLMSSRKIWTVLRTYCLYINPLTSNNIALCSLLCCAMKNFPIMLFHYILETCVIASQAWMALQRVLHALLTHFRFAWKLVLPESKNTYTRDLLCPWQLSYE